MSWPVKLMLIGYCLGIIGSAIMIVLAKRKSQHEMFSWAIWSLAGWLLMLVGRLLISAEKWYSRPISEAMDVLVYICAVVGFVALSYSIYLLRVWQKSDLVARQSRPAP